MDGTPSGGMPRSESAVMPELPYLHSSPPRTVEFTGIDTAGLGAVQPELADPSSSPPRAVESTDIEAESPSKVKYSKRLSIKNLFSKKGS